MSSVIYAYPGVAVGQLDDLFVILWTGDPTVSAAQWVVAKSRLFRAQRGEEIAPTTLQIITPDAGTPGAEARAYTQEIFKELNDERLVVAPLGDGFRQSIVRTMLRGMALFARKTDRLIICATLDEAYTETLRGRASRREELDRLVREMFKKLDYPDPRGGVETSAQL